MDYVDSLHIFGIPAKEIPCIKDAGEPTTATVGAVGMLYMDTDSGNIYKCVAVAEKVYTWEPISGDIADLKKQVDELSQYVADRTPVSVTQDEYDALEAAGKINEKTPYLIVEG